MKNFVQKIIFGSPGTGKSFRIDNYIIPHELSIDVNLSPENIIKAVFHPEYTHGDFVGKLLPITRSGKVEYSYYEGHFLKALSQAYKNIIKAYNRQGERAEDSNIENVALVIDEINRGNSSSIFGSVFQLLDRDSEGWSCYKININELAFIKILELIGVTISYDHKGEINEYKLKPHEGVKNLEALQGKINFLKFDLTNRTIKIPPNLSIIATMNTSDNSIYYMDSAFKRRWNWEYVDTDSDILIDNSIAFKDRESWEFFVRKLNKFIKSNYKYVRGIEDKQLGKYFIRDAPILNSDIQNKVMFFIWDNVFSRDKTPLQNLLFEKDSEINLITFGDFSRNINLFIDKISSINV